VAGLLTSLATPDAAGARFHPFTWHSAALILAIGVAALCAQMAMTRAYRVGKVLVVANLQYTGIVFSSLWGMALWGDRFDWHVWLGIGVILASGIAATFYNTNTRSTAQGAAIKKTDPIASEL
jgi:S-adenosylmethionine uptake transporter